MKSIACVAAVFFGLISPSVCGATEYTVTALDGLPAVANTGGIAPFVAEGINDDGAVVGYGATTADPTPRNALIYSSGTTQALGTIPGAASSQGYAINASGQVAGATFAVSQSNDVAFLYSNGTMQNLGTLPGYVESEGFAINTSGEVAGYAENPNTNAYQAFLYNGSTMIGLGALPGGAFSIADGINDGGQVTGVASTATAGQQVAFLYSGGTMQDLGTLGGQKSIGNAINNSGQVVGNAQIVDGRQDAFLYSGGTMHDLGVLPGFDSSSAVAINASGDVVGNSQVGDLSDAFLYTSSGGLVDLNSLIPAGSGWVLQGASGINDSGQIVGFGELNGVPMDFLLSPTPEPSTIVLAGIAIAVLGVQRMMRRKASCGWLAGRALFH